MERRRQRNPSAPSSEQCFQMQLGEMYSLQLVLTQQKKLLEPEYLHFKELHSPCSVLSDPGFYEIFKEATTMICLSYGKDSVLFIQNLVLNKVSISTILEYMDVEVACDKESGRRVQNVDCLATKLAEEDISKLYLLLYCN